MGVLTSFNPQAVSTEDARTTLKESVIKLGGRLFDESYHHMTELGEMLSVEDKEVNYRAGLTLQAVRRVEETIDSMVNMYGASAVQMAAGPMATLLGESVVQSSLGTLVPRILDVVRIFYPSMIIHEIMDIQPLGGQVGEIFTMRPRYEQTTMGVTAYSSQVFQTYPTSPYYASEVSVETVGTQGSSTTSWAYSVQNVPVRPSSVSLYYTISSVVYTATDDGNGNLVGTDVTSSTIDYTTGAVVFTTTTAVDNPSTITIQYSVSTESNESAIRSLTFDLGTTPIKAQLYPLTFSYSVSAGLAAQAHLALDVQDTMANLAGQYIKIERDYRGVSIIANAATHQSTLDFSASWANTSTYVDKRTLYSQIEIKVDEAEQLIQNAVGRGGMDFVICGREAANVFRQCRGFRPEPVRAPIGAHKIGTLRDGTVAVIKTVNDQYLNKDYYIFGFKGYMTGDSATILAEWIPIYFTPVFQAPTMVNRQGVFSAYNMFVNNASYYNYGVLSGYGA